jgi:hypothetical protein
MTEQFPLRRTITSEKCTPGLGNVHKKDEMCSW